MTDTTRELIGEAPTPQSSVAARERLRAPVASSSARGPARLGRYELRGVLGSGGMGTVFDAYDPELARAVAIKIVRYSATFPADHLSKRMLKEARALAAISHPNLVQIYDVAAEGPEPYIVMERVDGTVLTAWLRKARPWRTILGVFCAAGRGLAACHHAGVVHRDFKPSNVIVGRDEVIRVIDLGLVRELEKNRPLAAATDGHILVGTPAYLAPECLAGCAATEASDQFSFCVALYAALYGIRPFAGSSAADLLKAACRGDIRPPPTRHGAPAGLRRVVCRGLSRNLEDRYPSIDALLQQLERAASNRGRRWLPAALTLGALAGGAVWLTPQDAVTSCLAQLQAHRTAWGTAGRPAVRRALRAPGTAQSDFTADKVDGLLEAYAQELESHEAKTCRAAAPERPAFKRCIAGRRDAFESTVALLKDAAPAEIGNAVATASGLPVISACVGDQDPTSGSHATKSLAAELLRDIERARSLSTLGRYGEAGVLANWSRRRARELRLGGVWAEGTIVAAGVLAQSGRGRRAHAAFEDAFYAALDAAAFATASRAAAMLTAEAANQRRLPEAERWLRHTASLYTRLDKDQQQATRSDLEALRAIVAVQRGDYREAADRMQAAVAPLRNADGATEVRRAWMLSNLAGMQHAAGDLEAASQTAALSVAAHRGTLGSRHPSLAQALAVRGAVELDRYHLKDAEEATSEAVEIRAELLGEHHPETRVTALNLAVILMRRGQYEAAKPAVVEVERTLREQAPEHPLLPVVLTNRAWIELGLARPAEAVRFATEAVQRHEAATSASNPGLAPILEVRARAEAQAGSTAQAEETMARVTELRLTHFGATSWEFLLGQAALARVLLAAKKSERARDACHRMVAGLGGQLPADARLVEPFTECSEIELELGDRPRALRLAEQAVASSAGQDANREAYFARLARANAHPPGPRATKHLSAAKAMAKEIGLRARPAPRPPEG